MALDATANLIKAVASAQAAGDTTVTISTAAAALLPAAPFNMTWWLASTYSDPADDPNVEIIRVTVVNTGTGVLTITRAQEGTTATAKNLTGTYKLSLDITSKMITDISSNLYKSAKATAAVTGTINGSNVTFTLPWTPADPNTVILWLNQQPQLQGVHFTLSGVTVTYTTAPDGSLSGTGHYATGH